MLFRTEAVNAQGRAIEIPEVVTFKTYRTSAVILAATTLMILTLAMFVDVPLTLRVNGFGVYSEVRSSENMAPKPINIKFMIPGHAINNFRPGLVVQVKPRNAEVGCEWGLGTVIKIGPPFIPSSERPREVPKNFTLPINSKVSYFLVNIKLSEATSCLNRPPQDGVGTYTLGIGHRYIWQWLAVR